MRKGKVALLPVLVLSAIAGLSLFGFANLSGARQLEPWFFKTIIELVVQTESLHVERVIECTPSMPVGQVSEATPAYYNSRHLISQRLANGSGIMIVAPRVCSANTPVQRGYDPVVLWTDSADRPSTIEAYYSGEAARAGARKIALTSIKVDAPVERDSNSASLEFLDWSGGASRDPAPKGERVLFVSAYAFEISATEWSKNERIRAMLLERKTSGAVELNSELMVFLADQFPLPDDVWYRNGGFYPAKHPSLDAALQRTPLRSHDVIPIRLEEGRLFADFSSAGTMVFYPIEVARKFIRSSGPANVEIAGRSVSGNRGAGTYVWLADLRRLLLMNDTSFVFILNPR